MKHYNSAYVSEKEEREREGDRVSEGRDERGRGKEGNMV